MTTIDEALASNPGAIAAWSANAARRWLGIYRVGDGGASLVTGATMTSEDQKVRRDELGRRGVRVGTTSNGFVWIADSAGFALWDATRRVADTEGRSLRLGDHRIAADDVDAVVSFVDNRDLGHRGVFIVLKDQGHTLVVEEHDPAAEADPAYSVSNVIVDGAWAPHVASALAGWFGVPVRRDTEPPESSPMLDKLRS